MYPFFYISYIFSGNLWEKIQNWYQGSLTRELLEYLANTVFGVNFSTYENFVVGGSTGATVRNVVLGLLFGTIFAAGLMYYTRLVHGKFVRYLIRHACYTPDRAVTLRDAGVFRSVSVRRDLLRGGALSKVTRCVEEETHDPASKTPFKPDLLTDHFYIPDDLKYRAEFRYDRSGSGALPFWLTVVAAIALSVLICRCLPLLLTFADWLISVLS